MKPINGLLIVFYLLAFLCSPESRAIFLLSEETRPKVSLEQAVYGLHSDYREVARIVTYILRQYPPGQYAYVGVGRSPAPVLAFFKGVVSENIWTSLPLSGAGRMRIFNQVDPMDERELLAERSESLNSHFDHFLPSVESLAGRSLLLIDYAYSGKSLIEAVEQVRAYYWRRFSIQVQVGGLGLAADSGRPEAVANLRAYGIEPLAIAKNLRVRLEGREYREFAEYERFFVDSQGLKYSAPRRRGQEFDRLAEAYFMRAKIDKKLRATLKNLYPEARILGFQSPTWSDRVRCWRMLF